MSISNVFAPPPQAHVPVMDSDIALLAIALALMAATIIATFVAVPWMISLQ